MKKQIALTTAMAATLLALNACSNADEDVIADDDTAVCVDREGKRVDDSQCAPQTATNNHYHGGGGSSAFLWYYIGRNSAVPYYGDSIRDSRFAGGSYDRRPGANYRPAPASTRMTRSAAVSRGGLGSSGRSYSSGS